MTSTILPDRAPRNRGDPVLAQSLLVAQRRLTDRTLDLDTLDVLERVAATGSLTRAAEMLGITQQAVSSRIAVAERSAGVRLLERSASGSTLTPAGMTVLELAAPVLDAARRLEAGLTALSRPTGRTTVAASQTVAELLLPVWLQRLRASRPDAAVRLIAGNSADTVLAVRDGTADLGFVESPAAPEELSAEVVTRDELAVVVASSHPWAGRGSIGLEELARTPLLVRESGSGTRATLEDRLSAEGLELGEPAAVLGTTAVIRASTLAGVAPAVMSIRTVEADLDAGRLVRIPLDGAPIDRPLTAIWSARRLTPDARALLVIARAG